MDLPTEYWPWLAVGLATLCLIAWAFGIGRARSYPYEKRASLLTPAELHFYDSLREAAGGQWAICAMVRMADLIKVRPNTQKFQAWQNRIHAKHIDFLLCDQETMEARLAVELDDRSHERPDRVARDQFVNQALGAAGVPLLRIDVQKSYDHDELKQQIERLVAQRRTTGPLARRAG